VNNRKWKIVTAAMSAITIASLLWAANTNRGMQKFDDYICVDIGTKDGCYYSLQSDCELTYIHGSKHINGGDKNGRKPEIIAPYENGREGYQKQCASGQ
jgi:hypothetical protein